MNKVEKNVKIIVVGTNRAGLGQLTISRNINLDFTPDVVQIRSVHFYDNNAVPVYSCILTSDLCLDPVMCAITESHTGGNGNILNIDLPLKKAINGKYTFTLLDIDNGYSIATAVANFFFSMTLRFVEYEK